MAVGLAFGCGVTVPGDSGPNRAMLFAQVGEPDTAIPIDFCRFIS